MKTILLIGSVLLLTACDQQFRYPCQNPKNWDTPRCQQPQCEINRDCPEYIFDDSSQSKNVNSVTNRYTKGCN
jgi:hypothetical protein